MQEEKKGNLANERASEKKSMKIFFKYRFTFEDKPLGQRSVENVPLFFGIICYTLSVPVFS